MSTDVHAKTINLKTEPAAQTEAPAQKTEVKTTSFALIASVAVVITMVLALMGLSWAIFNLSASFVMAAGLLLSTWIVARVIRDFRHRNA